MCPEPAGKSTLLNTMTGAGVLAEDQLFATLDPTTRRLRLKGNKEVGFAVLYVGNAMGGVVTWRATACVRGVSLRLEREDRLMAVVASSRRKVVR